MGGVESVYMYVYVCMGTRGKTEGTRRERGGGEEVR